MDPINRMAFDATKEILVSALSTRDISACAEAGDDIADMFEAVYNRLLEIAKDAEVK
mgnify:FL=1